MSLQQVQNTQGGRLAGLFVRRPVLAVVINALIVVGGLAGFLGIEVRELPQVDQPVLTINTTFTGASADTVDREITSTVEGAVARVQGLTGITPGEKIPVQVIITPTGPELAGHGPLSPLHADQLCDGAPRINLEVPAATLSYAPSVALVKYVKARDRHCRFKGCRRAAMQVQPGLRAKRRRAIAKNAVRAPIALHRFEQVVGTVRRDRFVCLLRAESRTPEVVIGVSRRNLLAIDRLHGRIPHVHLATAMMSGPIHGACRDFRLVDRRHRLRMIGQLRTAPGELRRVHRRQVDDRDVHVRFRMDQFRPDGVCESYDCVLGATVRRLQRDRAVGER